MSKLTIALTGRRPVIIEEGDWPVIASASGDSFTGNDPALHAQASAQGDLDEYELKVRQHADGRVIVHGTYTKGWHTTRGDNLARAGSLLTAATATATESMIPDHIVLTGRDLSVPQQLIADCIADLPAEIL